MAPFCYKHGLPVRARGCSWSPSIFVKCLDIGLNLIRSKSGKRVQCTLGMILAYGLGNEQE